MIIRTCVFMVLLLPLSDYATAKKYSEHELRTLFTSPQEREKIDNNRESGVSVDGEVTGPSSVQVNGIVKRTNGKSVVWVNGKSTLDNAMIDGVKVYSNASNANNKIPVMIDGRKVYMKPGESWSEESGVSDVGR